MNSNTKPQAVIFDWDGTLVNTIPGLFKAHNHVRETMGYALWSHDEFFENMQHSSRDIYPRLYGERAEEAFATLYDFIETHHLNLLEVHEGAEELLIYLKEQNIPAALVSNKTHAYLVKEVAHLGWDDYFYYTIGAGQAAKDKPSADPLLMAVEAAITPLQIEQTWFIGDTETDLKTSRAAKCRSGLVLNGEDKSLLIKKYSPDFCFENCTALKAELAQYI